MSQGDRIDDGASWKSTVSELNTRCIQSDVGMVLILKFDCYGFEEMN